MNNRFALLFFTFMVTALTFVTFATTGANAASRVTSAVLQAESFPGAINCPESVDFSGTITMNGPGTVTYTFLRSDGATGPVLSMNFSKAGTMAVHDTWTLGKSYQGYQKLRVLTPNVVETGEANFDLRCKVSIVNIKPVPVGVLKAIDSVNISCPIETARTEMVTPLSDGWWQTPQLGNLVSVAIESIGGEQTMVCRYSGYGTQIGVMKSFPAGKTCQVSGPDGFTCQ